MIRYTKVYISQLLNKFMEGTTTLEEEDILYEYFTQGYVPAEWEHYRLLFEEIGTMKPEKPKRYWWKWGIAAAVVAIILFATHQGQQTAHPDSALVVQKADKDSIAVQPEVEASTGLTPSIKNDQQPSKDTKRRLRKSQPAITDYDKRYHLMAQTEQEIQQTEQEIQQAEQEIQQAEQEIQQAQQEILQARREMLHAHLTTDGYVAIQLEDGTIIYTNEPIDYFTYEE